MAKTKQTEEKAEYIATLSINALIYTGKGATVKEAVENMGINYTHVKTKGELIVKRGDRTATRFMPLPKLRRVFASTILMRGLIRDIEKLLA